ncbi:MAG TPA: hypothetical protein VFU98_03795, partial [Microlunatus sp.]|nr:hypothetical protein [Microlunatus sp.]
MNVVFSPPSGARFRVISDDDYAGDPDGLFQLAHHLLSPSVQVRAVTGSHVAADDPFDADPASGRYALLPRPGIGDDGSYLPNPEEHPLRVYSGLDVRVMLEDLHAKLGLHGRAR